MTPATVPMISPDGQSGDIPQARAQDAINAGFKPAMVMTAPDGKTTGYIPQERAADAIKAGFKPGQAISPDAAGLQPKDSAFYGDLKNMIPTTVDGVVRMMPDPASRVYTAYQDAKSDVESVKATGRTIQQRKDDARKAAGYGPGYRIIAPVGEQLGVNATGMEQAAKEGDSAAVLGHAAAAAAPYVAGAIGGEVMRAPAVKSAVSATADAVKAAPKAVVNAVSKVVNVARFADPDLVGLASPRAAHALRVLGKLDDVITKSQVKPAAATPDTSVPASSVSTTQFPPKVDLSKIPTPGGAPMVEQASAAMPTPSMTQFPPPMPKDPVAAAPIKVKAILDDAHAQIQQVVEDAKKSTPTKDQPAAPGSREDKLDDRAMSQEMGWDVARHYFKGIAEQRDMAASALSSKTELTTQAKVDTILAKAADDARTVLESAKIPAEGTKARIAGRIPASWVKDGKISLPKPGDDLVDLLQRSIDAAKTKKGPGSGGEGNGGTK